MLLIGSLCIQRATDEDELSAGRRRNFLPPHCSHRAPSRPRFKKNVKSSFYNEDTASKRKRASIHSGNGVPHRRLLPQLISIDKDSGGYRQAQHRPARAFLFWSQNGLRGGRSFHPNCSTESHLKSWNSGAAEHAVAICLVTGGCHG